MMNARNLSWFGLLAVTAILLAGRGVAGWGNASAAGAISHDAEPVFEWEAIPIGGIVAYAGDADALWGTGWVLCDGSVVDETHPAQLAPSRVSPQFWGRRVPDLIGRVPRGVLPGEAVGHQGGADVLAEHSTQLAGAHGHFAQHAHKLRGLTGKIANSGGDPGKADYKIRDDHDGWNGKHHIDVGGASTNNEGHHYHTLVGSTENTSVASSHDGRHEHLVTTRPHVPSYTGVQFIIRIGTPYSFDGWMPRRDGRAPVAARDDGVSSVNS